MLLYIPKQKPLRIVLNIYPEDGCQSKNISWSLFVKRFYSSIFLNNFFVNQPLFFMFRKIFMSFTTILMLLVFLFFRKLLYLSPRYCCFLFLFFRKILIPFTSLVEGVLCFLSFEDFLCFASFLLKAFTRNQSKLRELL